jgi:hypothetical protein
VRRFASIPALGAISTLLRGGLAAGGQQDGVYPTSETLGGRSHKPLSSTTPDRVRRSRPVFVRGQPVKRAGVGTVEYSDDCAYWSVASCLKLSGLAPASTHLLSVLHGGPKGRGN